MSKLIWEAFNADDNVLDFSNAFKSFLVENFGEFPIVLEDKDITKLEDIYSCGYKTGTGILINAIKINGVIRIYEK